MPMYDPNWIQPMRDELTAIGVKEMRTPAEVDEVLSKTDGTVLVVVNSMCGCAAAGCRPGVKLALEGAKRPTTLTTVFAGQDAEATEKARSYFVGYPPSSPSVALMKDRKIVYMLERRGIEGKSAQEIAKSLTDAFEKHC